MVHPLFSNVLKISFIEEKEADYLSSSENLGLYEQ